MDAKALQKEQAKRKEYESKQLKNAEERGLSRFWMCVHEYGSSYTTSGSAVLASKIWIMVHYITNMKNTTKPSIPLVVKSNLDTFSYLAYLLVCCFECVMVKYVFYIVPPQRRSQFPL